MTAYQSIIIDDESLARQVIRTFVQKNPLFEVMAEAANGKEAVLQILHHKPQVIFLDIQMPEINGFHVVKEIWPYHQPFIVFTTAYDQYALHAFEVNAIDYLLKPFTEVRFGQALTRVEERIKERTQPKVDELVKSLLREEAHAPSYLRRILVKQQSKMFFVETKDITYLDANGNYITLHTSQKDHIIYESLTSLETKLDPADFVRINRSYIINLCFVQEVEAYFNGEYLVKLHSGQKLKWTRNYRENIKAFYNRK